MTAKQERIFVKIWTREEYYRLAEVIEARGLRGLSELALSHVFRRGNRKQPIQIGLPSSNIQGEVGYTDPESTHYLERGYLEMKLSELIVPRLVQKTFDWEAPPK